jgi:hypothetical protein
MISGPVYCGVLPNREQELARKSCHSLRRTKLRNLRGQSDPIFDMAALGDLSYLQASAEQDVTDTKTQPPRKCRFLTLSTLNFQRDTPAQYEIQGWTNNTSSIKESENYRATAKFEKYSVAIEILRKREPNSAIEIILSDISGPQR